MKKVIEYIVKSLCDYPDDVEIEVESDRDADVVKITVVSSDMGKVIGRNGKIANSIRTIAKSLSSKQHKRVIIKIDEK